MAVQHACRPHDHPAHQEGWEDWPCPNPMCRSTLRLSWRHDAIDPACKLLHYSDRLYCPKCFYCQPATAVIHLQLTRLVTTFCFACHGKGYCVSGLSTTLRDNAKPARRKRKASTHVA